MYYFIFRLHIMILVIFYKIIQTVYKYTLGYFLCSINIFLFRWVLLHTRTDNLITTTCIFLFTRTDTFEILYITYFIHIKDILLSIITPISYTNKLIFNTQISLYGPQCSSIIWFNFFKYMLYFAYK